MYVDAQMSPMNLAILSKKGGVGKSTVSVLLYEAFRHAGKTVAIHDWDAQGNVFARVRKKLNLSSPPR